MFRRRAIARKPRAKNYRKRRMVRKIRAVKPRHHIFSETFRASNLVINNDGSASTLPGQELTASMNSVQQMASYKALYDKYRILKLTWTIIPKWGVSEPNQAEYNVGSGGPYDSNVRIHYRRSWQNISPSPPDELTFLQQNGVRTLMLGRKPLKISMRYPTTQQAYDSGGGLNTIFEEKNKWCAFNDTVLPSHGSLSVFTASDSSGLLGQTGTVCATVFCKVTFAVGDPK